MVETYNDFFTALLAGTGNLIGLLLVLAFFVVLTLAWKYSAVFLVPASLLFSIFYIQNDLIWNSIIMLAFTVFAVFHASKEFT